jgi:Mrp family chromosome partitioning ATPase
VGKTTVAVNLARALSLEDNVGLLDADINGPNAPKMMGASGGLHLSSDQKILPIAVGRVKLVSMSFMLPDEDTPVIWRGPLKSKAIKEFFDDTEWGDIEYLVIDLPPGTGDEALSVALSIGGVDGAIIVTTPQEVSLLDSRKAINFARKLDMPVIGVIENMSGLICPHCGGAIDLFKVGGGERTALDMKASFLGRIPIDPRIVTLADLGDSPFDEIPDSPAVKALMDIAGEVKASLMA